VQAELAADALSLLAASLERLTPARLADAAALLATSGPALGQPPSAQLTLRVQVRVAQ
jgi:hypothetical protein